MLAGDFVTDDAAPALFTWPLPRFRRLRALREERARQPDDPQHPRRTRPSPTTSRSSKANRSSTPRARKAPPTGPSSTSCVEANALLARGRMTHSYPHSWRSKAPVIYRNTPQWFVGIDRPLDDGMDTYGQTIRERALTSIDRLVQWFPVTGRNRLYSMIEARPDWVLSRQRAWGVPLHLLRQTASRAGSPARDPARPGGQRQDQGGFRARGCRRLVRGQCQGPVPRQRLPAR